ncbi:MAG: ferritin-like domain-containing protein [Nocardioides sp.]|uniref:ferritin-like domain-containing protein n=1 Tax=Nocardioides sp. TaxID=35761 RepID=UPI0039E56242
MLVAGSDPRRPLLSRRTVIRLGALSTTVLLVGCDAAGRNPSEPGTTSPSSAGSIAGTATSSPDRLTLLALAEETASLRAQLGELARRRAETRRSSRALRRTHDAQLAALQQLTGTTASPTPSPRSPGWQRLLAAEHDHFHRLASAADEIEDGPVAWPIASMAAGQAIAWETAAGKTTTPVDTGPPAADQDALQEVLAAEHAAIYVYGVLGGRTSQAGQPALFEELLAGYLVHRGRRDALTQMLRSQGADPVAAEPAYDVAGPPSTPAQVRAGAAALEEAAAQQYAALVAAAPAGSRSWAVAALVDAARRAVAFGDAPTPFPGAPELG